jgi:hypothetical protein
MVTRSIVVASLLMAAWAGPASAQMQDVFCRRRGGVDPQGTQMLREMLNVRDQQPASALAGTWYSESQATDTGQMSYLYQRFQLNGLYSYQNRVCAASTGYCSDYAGHGLFGAQRRADGTLFALVMVSDLERDHVCNSLSGQVDGDMFTGGDGQAMRRVGQ